MLIVFLCIHGISIVLCALIAYEFIHIHTKRVALLDSIVQQDVRVFARGRKRSVILYTLSTLAVIIFTTIQLFS